MKTRAFAQPNLHKLSENGIGDVMQRSQISPYLSTNTHPTIAQDISLNQNGDVTAHGFCTKSATISGKTFSEFASDTSSSLGPMSQQPDTRKLPFPDEIKANIAVYHRERRRKNQARYRAKQHRLITDQEAYNSELQQEIVELRWKRETLMLDITRRDSVWAVAVEYFSVFRLGLDTAGGACTTTLDFLRATMAPDLDAGTVFGPNALARNWVYFTRSFRDIQIRLGRLDQISENSLVAYCTTSITITRSTLSSLLPRLVDQCFNHNNASKWCRIADSLVGQRLVLDGSVRFTWDTTNNCVTSLITKADMLSPLLRLLGNFGGCFPGIPSRAYKS